MGVYDRISAGRDRLLTLFGSTASVSRITKTYDKVTEAISETVVNFACKAVLGTVSEDFENGIQGSEAEIVLNVEVAAGDRITLAGKAYIVDSVDVEKPNGVPILWTAKVRL